MPLVFPLSVSLFANVIRACADADGQRFVLNEPVMSAGGGEGTIYTAANGSAMWEGTIRTVPARGAAAHRIEALMDALRGAGRSFLMWDMTRDGPENDPAGAVVAGRQLVIAALEASRLKIGAASGQPVIKGFPPELRLLPGDPIGIRYGSNPVRYGYHRVAPAATSYGYDRNRPGRSVWVDVVPPIRPGATVGSAVTLYRPTLKAVPVPGSISGGESMSAGWFAGWSLDWRQTLR